jgi:hypothetical protein
MFKNDSNIPVTYVINGDVITVKPGQQVADNGDLSFPTIQQAALAARVTPLTIGQQLAEWATGDDYQVLTTVRNADGVVTSATVRWPDDSPGTLNAVGYNSTFGVYDSFTITHDLSLNTVTQPTVTRDANGAVINKPAVVVN